MRPIKKPRAVCRLKYRLTLPPNTGTAISGDMVFPVNARDIIEQFKALPKNEQAKVVEFISGIVALQRAEKVNFDEAASTVFAEHEELMRKLSQ